MALIMTHLVIIIKILRLLVFFSMDNLVCHKVSECLIRLALIIDLLVVLLITRVLFHKLLNVAYLPVCSVLTVLPSHKICSELWPNRRGRVPEIR